jgi:hypothetical protein
MIIQVPPMFLANSMRWASQNLNYLHLDYVSLPSHGLSTWLG